MEKKVIASPSVVLREEFDDWAILFDPDTGKAFGLNPIGVLIWKNLNGLNDEAAIVQQIHEKADGIPDDVDHHVRNFLQAAVDLGLAGYEVERS